MHKTMRSGDLSWQRRKDGRMVSNHGDPNTFDPKHYVGLSLGEARALGVESGWDVTESWPGMATSLDIRPNRLTLHLTAEGVVRKTSIG